MVAAIKYPCPKCDEVLYSKQDYIQHMEKHKANEPTVIPKAQVQAQQAAQQPLKPRPIKLKYVYEGGCTACGLPVETIELDVANQHVAVAWCSRCKKDITQNIVTKL